MLEYVLFDYEKKYIEDFLALPQKLYQENENMEDRGEVKKLLLDTHPLSEYFKLYKFLIYKNGEVSARFVLTKYPKDTTLYLGFFECVNEKDVVDYLFYSVEHFAKLHGYKQIVGPVDASFWIKYRLKISNFNKQPYTGEPYNKDYYYQLFLSHGYVVFEHYTSNIFPIVSNEYQNNKFVERYKKAILEGYEIKSPTRMEYNKSIDEVYDMIIDLYSDFPIFKKIRRETFLNIFKKYKYIIDYRMIKMAYYKGKSVGFFISIPNYSNKVYHLNNLTNIFDCLKIRKHPQEYVMLYMGAKREHQGIGSALADSILEEIRQLKVPSIGALMRDGKKTQKYANDLIEDSYEYVLLKKDV